MKLGAFELNEPLPELKEPHALAILKSWVDVSNVGTLTLSWIERHFETKELARLTTPGDFFAFTRCRPTSYVKGGHRQVTIPNTYITYGQQETGNDYFFPISWSHIATPSYILSRFHNSWQSSASKGITSSAACMITFLIPDPF